MDSDTSSAAWLYFRIFIGLVLLALFVYLILTNSFNTDLIARLLMLLIGVLEAGSGIIAFRSTRHRTKK